MSWRGASLAGWSPGLIVSSEQNWVWWLVHTYNLRTQEAESEGSKVPSPRLHSEFQTSWAPGVLPQTNSKDEQDNSSPLGTRGGFLISNCVRINAERDRRHHLCYYEQEEGFGTHGPVGECLPARCKAIPELDLKLLFFFPFELKKK